MWLDPSLLPGTSRFVEFEGARLHVVEAGTHTTRTVLLVHGSPLWSFTWRHCVHALSPDARCIAVDLPGMGLSTATRKPGHSFERNADLIARLIDHLDLRNFTVVVHATGGPSVLEAASRIPERVRGIAVINSFAWPLDEHPKLAGMVRFVGSRAFHLANVELGLLPRAAQLRGRRIGSFNAAERNAIGGPFRSREARLHLQDLLSDLTRERQWFASVELKLKRLKKQPFLLAYGALDNGFRGGLYERWQTYFPHYRTAVHPHAGHFLSEDDPKFLTDQLQRWIQLDVDHE